MAAGCTRLRRTVTRPIEEAVVDARMVNLR